MAYSCEIERDSISERGYRLTTFVVTFPRIILAEFNTHRMFSRNSASSRAIPVRKQVLAVLDDPFIPAEFGTDVGGMQAGPPLEGERAETARKLWLKQRDMAVTTALELMSSPDYVEGVLLDTQGDLRRAAEYIGREYLDKSSGLRRRPDLLATTKGITNRPLEPFMWHTAITTASEWSNFFALRTDENAQLEIRTIAEMMQNQYNQHVPTEVRNGGWHLPFTTEKDGDNIDLLRKLSTARSARVSYLTHDGENDPEKDVAMHDRLLSLGHMSPFEHAATPIVGQFQRLTDGNFRGWKQYRKFIPNEDDFSKVKPDA